jgi:hypothetical protein
MCKENHWSIKDGRLILETPGGLDQAKSRAMERAIEARVRLEIYDEICAVKLTDNRKQIMKNGLENALLTVQDLFADIVIGNKK